MKESTIHALQKTLLIQVKLGYSPADVPYKMYLRTP